MNKNKRKVSQDVGLITQAADNTVSNAASNASNNAAIDSGKLALIAGMVSTFGDALGTLAAAMALEEAAASDLADQQAANEQDRKIADLQRQIDELTLQIKRLSR